jgi:hypothetical protein
MSTRENTASSRPAPLRLHLPDEPRAQRDRWRDAVLGGQVLSDVLGDLDGIIAWLWARWSSLDMYGMDEAAFSSVVADYRRELWRWLIGDRTWEQCCSGLIGRLGRRLGYAR